MDRREDFLSRGMGMGILGGGGVVVRHVCMEIICAVYYASLTCLIYEVL